MMCNRVYRACTERQRLGLQAAEPAVSCVGWKMHIRRLGAACGACVYSIAAAPV